ncbi:MAG: hypothetical protein GY765_41900, partial [bacterium]|nr:hypothetical protein [bacterium]
MKKKRFISIEPTEKRDYYPLSPAQKRVYILQQMENENISYNMPYNFPVQKDIDIAKLQETVKELIRRHESLRTTFHMLEEPVQKVHEAHEVAFRVDEYRIESGKQGEDLQKSALSDYFTRFVRPFQLTHPPLLRITLIHMGEVEEFDMLLLDMHHIITDGISQQRLEREFAQLYQGEKLPPLAIQYKDYSQWWNTPRQQETLKNQEAYWLEKYKGDNPQMNLPIDYSPPEILESAGSKLDFEIDRQLTAKIKDNLKEMEITLYMFLLAVYSVMLSKYTGTKDIIVGTPTAGRTHDDLNNIIGMFVNMLPMRNFPESSKTFREFVREVRTNSLDAFENQE